MNQIQAHREENGFFVLYSTNPDIMLTCCTCRSRLHAWHYKNGVRVMVAHEPGCSTRDEPIFYTMDEFETFVEQYEINMRWRSTL